MSALHIAHALKQTEIQKSYNKAREKPIDEYLVSFNFFILLSIRFGKLTSLAKKLLRLEKCLSNRVTFNEIRRHHLDDG